MLPISRGLILLPLALLAVAPARPLAAQNAATVEALAPILAAEDARRFDGALFATALRSPDSVVQQYAIRAIGRIGDPDGVPLLTAYLAQPDSTYDAEAAFALGLIGDTSAAAPIIAWLTGPQAIGQVASLEGATALCRIGGPTAAAFVAQALSASSSGLRMPDVVAFQQQLLAEAWRLGRRAPVTALVDAVRADQPGGSRYPATYSLVRLHPTSAATALVLLARDQNVAIRSLAVRVMTRAFADSAGLPRADVAGAAVQELGDPDPGSRINALRALESFRGDSSLSGEVIPLTDDGVGNVEVQALETLGALGGTRAADLLAHVAGDKRPWAVRRQALLSLARVDSSQFRRAVGPWASSADWRDRAAAAEGWAAIPGSRYPVSFLSDPDGRVVAAALQAWAGAVKGADTTLARTARRHLGDADAAVRSVAADIIARAPVAADLAPLTTAFSRAQRDSFPDAGESALGAIKALAGAVGGAQASRFAATAPAPAPALGYLYRAWAEANWPELSDHWGPSTPITTGRSLEDYRSIARLFILGTPDQRSPQVTVELAGNGTLGLTLFGADAPLTVANFLRLVDAGFFNGDHWHRVVPNFVVQDGDPRGDGWGGPGTVIRDEINRHRYGTGTLGMALSGPNTGGSQWFITLSPQPHLDGTYTVFGTLATGSASLGRILQGDLIRSIHR
ncbi:MAG TPA: peptidylprolyl isomerase [Gemmatimonadales bacterium]|nr:peptidylprolyl isomerase [Gemmatimonadales bacterium]